MTWRRFHHRQHHRLRRRDRGPGRRGTSWTLAINSCPTVTLHYTFSSNNDDQLVGACSRKTLFYLISTLNQSYGSDYDFSKVKSDEFSHEPSVTWVKNFIDSSLTAALSNKFTPQMRNQVSHYNDIIAVHISKFS